MSALDDAVKEARGQVTRARDSLYVRDMAAILHGAIIDLIQAVERESTHLVDTRRLGDIGPVIQAMADGRVPDVNPPRTTPERLADAEREAGQQ